MQSTGQTCNEYVIGCLAHSEFRQPAQMAFDVRRTMRHIGLPLPGE
jgi:hypothetical protein